MKRVDHMIRYLSGDLNRTESEEFERELSGDRDLKEEFDRVSFTYDLIGEKIRQRDEEAFRLKLISAMDKPERVVQRKKFRPGWYLLLPVAASVAILLAIYLMRPGPERVYSAFYTPHKDHVVTGFCQETRGEAAPALSYYRQGSYLSAFNATKDLLSNNPGSHHILLFHLLSAIELDREHEVLPMLNEAPSGPGYLPEQSLAWYHALALIKTGRTSEAMKLLHTLQVHPGPYRKDAHKLEKKLMK